MFNGAEPNDTTPSTIFHTLKNCLSVIEMIGVDIAFNTLGCILVGPGIISNLSWNFNDSINV
ncbi:hypothetical protein BLOT_008356 [Blomia tropicalis]|nr:hypothetical protein BLOT_008356 [Blomia tropicalis]